METVTPSGNRYIMTLIDDFSRYTVVYLLRKKSEAASKIKEYVRWVKNVFGRKPLVIRSDGGGEFMNRDLQAFYESEGIKAQFTTPYSPQQNGVAERKNRSLQEMAICLLADANMTKLYWGEAVMTAAYLQNRLPSRVVEGTPYELWTGRKPDIRHFRVFGCEAYVHIPDVKRSKLDQKAVKLRFVGYSEDHKGYRFLDEATNRITISRDAKFLELGDGSEQDMEQEELGAVGEEIEIPCKSKELEGEPGSDSSFEGWDSASDGSGEEMFRGFDEAEMDNRSERELEDQADAVEPQNVDNDEGQELRREDRRSRGVLPSRFNDFVVGVAESSQEEPSCYEEAAKVTEWKQAMDAEMQSHGSNQTWELVQLPKGKKIIGSKWIFKLKRNEIGEVVKHKARLVAQGYNQRFGIDYVDVFAPVTRLATLRTVLAIAGKRQMILHHFDIKTAYLNGTLEEEVYMRQPPGYEATGQESLVCRIKKSIYGLKQSARCWNRALHDVLIRLNFKQCQSDPCLYLRSDGDRTVILLVYVDDLLVACKEEDEIQAIYMALREAFEATNLGPVRQFLGLEVQRSEGYYSIRLASYIETLLNKFEMADCNPSKTPMEAGYLSVDEESDQLVDITRYRSLVGGLLYVAVNARPDIAVSVAILGRSVSRPTERDWKAAKRVVRYLKGTKQFKLEFRPGDGWDLVGYSDADWAGDQRSRRSTTGFIYFVGSGPVAWVSRRQSSVSLSSMEAEYIALSEASQELIWLRRLLNEIGEDISMATTVYEDNQSCLSFVKAERTSKRSKHIDTKMHFVKDLCDRGDLKLVYCPSNEMIADALTKPLGAVRFREMLERMGIRQ